MSRISYTFDLIDLGLSDLGLYTSVFELNPLYHYLRYFYIRVMFTIEKSSSRIITYITRRSDSTIWWPLRITGTLTSKLDLAYFCLLSHTSVPAG